jgi:hypothetical protein
MPYTIEQHPTMPLFITTFTGYISADEFAQWDTELLSMIGELKLSYGYVLMDIRQAETDFAAIVQGLTHISQAISAAETTIEGTFAFLGTHPMARLSVDMLRQPQYGGVEVPIFLTYEDAIVALEVDMKLRQQHGKEAE